MNANLIIKVLKNYKKDTWNRDRELNFDELIRLPSEQMCSLDEQPEAKLIQNRNVSFLSFNWIFQLITFHGIPSREQAQWQWRRESKLNAFVAMSSF